MARRNVAAISDDEEDYTPTLPAKTPLKSSMKAPMTGRKQRMLRRPEDTPSLTKVKTFDLERTARRKPKTNLFASFISTDEDTIHDLMPVIPAQLDNSVLDGDKSVKKTTLELFGRSRLQPVVYDSSDEEDVTTSTDKDSSMDTTASTDRDMSVEQSISQHKSPIVSNASEDVKNSPEAASEEWPEDQLLRELGALSIGQKPQDEKISDTAAEDKASGSDVSEHAESEFDPSEYRTPEPSPPGTPSTYGAKHATITYTPAKSHPPTKIDERPSTPPLKSLASKPTLKSPSKRAARLPTAPLNDEAEDFWCQTATNDWVDQHSPQKPLLRSPAKKQAPAATNMQTMNDAPFLMTPAKALTKEDRDARRVFEGAKYQIAADFFFKVDQALTGGKVAAMTESTGGVRILWNKKLSTTAGRAHWRKETTSTKHRDGTEEQSEKHHCKIEISDKVINDELRLVNVIAHEYCHLATYMISEVKNNPHGKEFKAWARKATRQFGACGVEVTTKHSYSIDFKYHWDCTGCPQMYKRHSRSIDVARQRCGKCKSELVQTKPMPRSGGPTEYQLFVQEVYAKTKAAHPEFTQSQIMVELSRLYRERKEASVTSSQALSEKVVTLPASSQNPSIQEPSLSPLQLGDITTGMGQVDLTV